MEALPLLRAGARTLAATTNLWARECPGLMPVEVGSLLHWASVDATRAQRLLGSLVTWRDVAMHPHEPPSPDAAPGRNAVRHLEAVSGVLSLAFVAGGAGAHVMGRGARDVPAARLLRPVSIGRGRWVGRLLAGREPGPGRRTGMLIHRIGPTKVAGSPNSRNWSPSRGAASRPLARSDAGDDKGTRSVALDTGEKR